MIFLTKFRSNDLHPSKGKQIEFNTALARDFFHFTLSSHEIELDCRSLADSSVTQKVKAKLTLSPARGDYKIYQNADGTADLKDFFLQTLNLTQENNLDDYYAIEKLDDIRYRLYYIPKDMLFTTFGKHFSGKVMTISKEKEFSKDSLPRQIIYYGAPGTGKSNKIDEMTNEENRIRTTFHPDSDYSTFVGAYKPTMKKQQVYEASGSVREDEQISYSFVAQAFLKAYVEAWTRWNDGNTEPYYLIIEEINRGNCAQIFGDLFQLLDRDGEGKSRYAISPDDDIRKHLAEKFDKCTNLDAKIKSGELMMLPSNLYIWATMNTSDQSLFPIDSAFKRRWDWEYIPIENAGEGFYIEIGDKKYDWWNFVETINKKIDAITGSEDKKLGYWFAKPTGDSKVITSKMFVSKVLFYLWNDVYKDYAKSNQSIFHIKTGENCEEVAFSEFFGQEAEEKMQAFMEYNGIHQCGQ